MHTYDWLDSLCSKVPGTVVDHNVIETGPEVLEQKGNFIQPFVQCLVCMIFDP